MGWGWFSWDSFGGRGLVQIGTGLRLVQVGDGGCRGTRRARGQVLGECKRAIIERNKIQLLSKIKK